MTQGVSVARYLKHFLDVYLEKIPVIKEHREAYARAVNELEDGVAKISNEIRDETLVQIRDQFIITRKIPAYGELEASFPSTKALTYEKPNLDAFDVIDGEFSVDAGKPLTRGEEIHET